MSFCMNLDQVCPKAKRDRQFNNDYFLPGGGVALHCWPTTKREYCS